MSDDIGGRLRVGRRSGAAIWVAGALGMVAVLAAAMGLSDGGEGAERGWMAGAGRRRWVGLMEDADLCATQVESACFDGSAFQIRSPHTSLQHGTKSSLFGSFDLHWSSPESGDVWYNSRASKKMLVPTDRARGQDISSQPSPPEALTECIN